MTLVHTIHRAQLGENFDRIVQQCGIDLLALAEFSGCGHPDKRDPSSLTTWLQRGEAWSRAGRPSRSPESFQNPEIMGHFTLDKP
jgi:hypothetical protein